MAKTDSAAYALVAHEPFLGRLLAAQQPNVARSIPASALPRDDSRPVLNTSRTHASGRPGSRSRLVGSGWRACCNLLVVIRQAKAGISLHNGRQIWQ